MKNLHSDWISERQSGIGASDAAAIFGMSPYKNNVQLWEEKTGRRAPSDISDDPFVKYGTVAEKYLRELYKLDFPKHNITHKPFEIIRSKQYPFLFCTPDGKIRDADGHRGVLEIKTTEIMQSQQWQKWNGSLPDNYFIQLLHQLVATGWEFAVLKAQIKYTDKDGNKQATIRHYRIDRGTKQIEDSINILIEKEVRFWGYVERDERPPLTLPEI